MAAIFALGAAGVGAFIDRRWTSARILLQVEGFMLALILLAVVRARGDFPVQGSDLGVCRRFLGLTAGSAILYARMARRAAPR